MARSAPVCALRWPTLRPGRPTHPIIRILSNGGCFSAATGLQRSSPGVMVYKIHVSEKRDT
eukprot:4878062-Prymnesium_polylepis.1